MLLIAIGAAMFLVGAAMVVRASTLIREFNADVTRITGIESDVHQLKQAVRRFAPSGQVPVVAGNGSAPSDRRILRD